MKAFVKRIAPFPRPYVWPALAVCLALMSPASTLARPDEDTIAGREAIYAQFAMGVYLLERGEAARAIALLDFAWRESERDPAVGERLAEAYYAVRNLDKAESVADDVIKKSPQNLESLQLKARVRYAEGDYEGAIAHLERARKVRTSFETERL